MNRHLVTAVGVGGNAEIPAAVLSAGADETEDADGAVGRIVLLQSVTVVGQLRLQLRAGFLPDYFQGMVALRFAAQRGVRA